MHFIWTSYNLAQHDRDAHDHVGIIATPRTPCCTSKFK